MTINNNPASLQQNNYLNNAQKASEKALGNIAAIRAISGVDTADLAIADSLRSQASTIDQGVANAYDAVGVLQIADASLSQITKTTDELSQLAVQRNSAVLNDQQKNMLDVRATELISSINDAFNNAQFNGKNVFQTMDFVVGSGVETTNLNPLSTGNLSLTDQSSIDSFSQQVASLRADIGAGINAITSNISASVENSINTKAAEGNLLNDDLAKNVTDLNAEFLKTNSASFMMAHQNDILQSKVASLLQ
ncbi:flagellin [Campylobacter sp. MIT 12-8780]|uniref:flagellin n=1 Tax=unclassified Campylobacter TaxID=2593542 RepID=UPI0010F7151B|nr:MULTISPECIES: flagellin [unclassified Campylobacter]TKX29087.1 flagellin [Campylobacter sp. MIT 12-5580]TQR41901.1 flagellin [Campylobacter sp. MIT 12-8780]